MRPVPSKTLIARVKRNAKRRAKGEALTHSQALELEARALGYPSWYDLTQAAAKPQVRCLPIDLPIDPNLPADFDSTPNDERSTQELDEWWDRPYALTLPDGTLQVRVLAGGSWDRSTSLGIAADASEALQLARTKLAEWWRTRARPVPYLRENGRCDVVRMPQRPDEDEVILAEDLSLDEAAAWIRSQAE